MSRVFFFWLMVRSLDLPASEFRSDYFTTATPSPQQGSAEVVSFSTSGSTGQFSIAALRACELLQQFKERNNLAGNLFVEQCLRPLRCLRPTASLSAPSILGSAEYEVYTKGIYQQAQDIGPAGRRFRFRYHEQPVTNSTGAQFGNAKATGNSTCRHVRGEGARLSSSSTRRWSRA